MTSQLCGSKDMVRHQFIVVLAMLLAPVPGRGAEPRPSAMQLRSEATRQYRAGQFEKACALYEKAAALAPRDAGIAADLGLCLSNIGKPQEALASDMRAIALATAGNSPNAPKTRLNVYYNLFQLNEDYSPPECSKRFVIKSAQAEQFGGLYVKSTLKRIAADEVRAEIPIPDAGSPGEEIPSGLPGDVEAFEGPTIEKDHVDVPCYESGWTGQALGANPQTSPSEEDRREGLEMSHCCKLVYANACTGVIGVVCFRGDREKAQAFEARLPAIIDAPDGGSFKPKR